MRNLKFVNPKPCVWRRVCTKLYKEIADRPRRLGTKIVVLSVTALDARERERGGTITNMRGHFYGEQTYKHANCWYCQTQRTTHQTQYPHHCTIVSQYPGLPLARRLTLVM